MHAAFTLVLVSAYALTPVHAQVANIPTCAQSCVVSALGSSAGGCSQTDFACLCGQRTFISAVSSCVAAACPSSDKAAAVQAMSTICAQAGVTALPLSTISSTFNIHTSTTVGLPVTSASIVPTAPITTAPFSSVSPGPSLSLSFTTESGSPSTVTASTIPGGPIHSTSVSAPPGSTTVLSGSTSQSTHLGASTTVPSPSLPPASGPSGTSTSTTPGSPTSPTNSAGSNSPTTKPSSAVLTRAIPCLSVLGVVVISVFLI